MGVLEALMSNIGRARGSRVQAWSSGLLACRGEAASGKAGGVSGPWAVSSRGTSAHSCMVAASTSPMEHARTAQGLSAVERNHVRSLNELAGFTWERTSLNVVSNCPHTLAHRSSCFSASFSFCPVVSASILPISLAISSSSLEFCSCCLWSSSYAGWYFAWVTTCSCLRAALRSSP